MGRFFLTFHLKESPNIVWGEGGLTLIRNQHESNHRFPNQWLYTSIFKYIYIRYIDGISIDFPLPHGQNWSRNSQSTHPEAFASKSAAPSPHIRGGHGAMATKNIKGVSKNCEFTRNIIYYHTIFP